MEFEPRTKPSLSDVVDHVIDKGIVIDYFGHVSVLGIDVATTIEARIIVASFETYLHHVDSIRYAGTIAGRLVR
jgi:hypothetical protein